MKLKPRTFQIFWDVHAWSGVVSSLLLFSMFFAAAFALFYVALDQWAAAPAPLLESTAELRLQPLFEQALRDLPKTREAETIGFEIKDHTVRGGWNKGEDHGHFHLDHRSGKLVPTTSELGSFLYELHFLGVIPYGTQLAGVVSLAFLLAIATGLLIHLKDLVRQWLQYRSDKPLRTWTSDLHKLIGLVGLPWQLLYAWTGAALCLGWIAVQPALVAGVFAGDVAAAEEARGSDWKELVRSGKPWRGAPDLDGMVALAKKSVPDLRPTWVGVREVGDQAARVEVYGRIDRVAFGGGHVSVDVEDGKVSNVRGLHNTNAITRFEAWFYGLHYGQFGGHPLRILYALMALGTCVVFVTGNLVWLERRDRLRRQRGNRFLQRATTVWCSGMVLAVAVLFVATRWLPSGLAERVAWEQRLFWGVWCVALLSGLGPWRDRKLAAALLGLAAVVYGGAGLADLTTYRLFALFERSGVNAGLLLLASSFGWSARWLLAAPAVPAAAPADTGDAPDDEA